MTRALKAISWLVLMVWAGVAAAQDVVGEVVTVAEGARLERDGRQFAIAPKVSILSGDAITTNGSGTVQLLFLDQTRVVVGPNSQFVARDIRMRRNGRAQRFAVNTVGGTFRFLSGNSAKNVYDIRTPSATMGVRGTQFDFAVERRNDTSLVMFDGEVQMCGAGRVCYAVSGSCATIRAGARGVNPDPVEDGAKAALLRRQFPFTQSQNRLGGGFRTSLLGCGPEDDDNPLLRPTRIERVAPPPPGQVVTPVQAPASGDGDNGGSTSGGGSGGGGGGGGGPRSGP
ncbi:MAG: FecR domain-containing protein [Pseudomonadota bacterium]